MEFNGFKSYKDKIRHDLYREFSMQLIVIKKEQDKLVEIVEKHLGLCMEHENEETKYE